MHMHHESILIAVHNISYKLYTSLGYSLYIPNSRYKSSTFCISSKILQVVIVWPPGGSEVGSPCLRLRIRDPRSDFVVSTGQPARMLVWVVVSNILYFHPYLGKWSNLTNIFQMGWNHQLVVCLILDMYFFNLLNITKTNIYRTPV